MAIQAGDELIPSPPVCGLLKLGSYTIKVRLVRKEWLDARIYHADFVIEEANSMQELRRIQAVVKEFPSTPIPAVSD